MFLFGAALFPSTSTLPPKHLLNLIAYSNKPKLKFKILFLLKRGNSANYFLPFAAGAWPGFGRLAPYLERLCVRPATPAVSNVPRTM